MISGSLEIVDRRPFCLYKGKEVGIAEGYFAGDRFCETLGDEYITEVSGRSFGWYDSHADYYKDDKSNFTRPSDEELVKGLLLNQDLQDLAVKKGLIKITKEEQPAFGYGVLEPICLN